MPYGKFEFKGKGGGLFWLFIWTNFLTLITLGIFGPWALVAQLKWITANIFIDGKRLCFKGTGGGYIANWLLIMLVSIITIGIYIPWGIVRIYRWILSNTYFADSGDIEYLVDTKEVEKIEYCTNCGVKLPSNATFCDQCGGKVR